MHRRREVPAALARLASIQSNMVTREQALGLGVSCQVLRRLVDSGLWLRVCPGLFATVPATPTWEALAWGGTLLGGPHARLGPEASGHLHGLIKRPPRPIDVLVPVATPTRVKGPWTFIRERDGVRTARSKGSPPRLTPECTVLDLVGQRAAGEAVSVLTGAVQKGLTTPDRLLRLLESRARQKHRALIVGVLTEVALGVESYLEMAYLKDVERPHGLPKGDRQTSHPDLPYQRDVKYERYGVLVELDGRTGHEGEGVFRDMNRDNRHALRDELTLRYGYYDIAGRPCPVAFQVYEAISRRGYVKPFIRCRGCLNVPEAELGAA